MCALVILDTNSLIYSLKQRANIRDLLSRFVEITGIVVPECVLHELESMSGDVMFASGALNLARTFRIIEGSGPADDCILDVASRQKCYILTNDRELIRRARKMGITTLSFRQSRRIDYS